MSTTIRPAGAVDPAAFTSSAAPQARPPRPARDVPVIDPPAVILPRTAAWLNPVSPASQAESPQTSTAAASPATDLPPPKGAILT